jgi:transcriptional regulator GlxA family with amidase domain
MKERFVPVFMGCPISSYMLAISRRPAKDLSDSPLVPWLREKHSQGTVIAAVCGGVFLLARTGLLAGRQATTHWALTDQFTSQFPDVRAHTESMVIDYGDVLTGAACWRGRMWASG